MKVNYWLKNNLLQMHCVLCLAPTTVQALCDSCRTDLPWLDNQQCVICALPLPTTDTICGTCLKNPPYFDRCRALFKYHSPIDTLISQFKYEGNLAVGELLSMLLVTHLPFTTTSLPDLLIPVPLHRSRLRERGFNQTSILADALSKHFSIPLDHHLCKRVRATSHQMGLNADVRKKNLRNAFTGTRLITNQSVIIIDDVVTTGSTVNELARTVRQAGAHYIEVWCLARTPSHT